MLLTKSDQQRRATQVTSVLVTKWATAWISVPGQLCRDVFGLVFRDFLAPSSQQLPDNTLAWFWAWQRPRTIPSSQFGCRHPVFEAREVQPRGHRLSHAIQFNGRTREQFLAGLFAGAHVTLNTSQLLWWASNLNEICLSWEVEHPEFVGRLKNFDTGKENVNQPYSMEMEKCNNVQLT